MLLKLTTVCYSQSIDPVRDLEPHEIYYLFNLDIFQTVLYI